MILAAVSSGSLAKLTSCTRMSSSAPSREEITTRLTSPRWRSMIGPWTRVRLQSAQWGKSSVSRWGMLPTRGNCFGLGGSCTSGANDEGAAVASDHGNGSYSFKLHVHPDFASEYNLSIVLLFCSFKGLKLSPEWFKFRREMRRISIRFYHSNALLPPLHICKGSTGSADFSKEVWSLREANAQVDF
ncbi:hypothetical protein Cni_G06940 [Canna indica]|uniref:Uncharacterized protein n=1 Tax=Canna indica TaxID=4628 RepID=A0AAQ3Q6H4_9LILI|nr:hypothetical protein Cni_G06940 [Canna indica]